jgi:hypothetical protein
MAIRANLSIDQGATFSTIISITDANNNVIDLSTYTGNAQIKKAYSSLNVAQTFTVSVNSTLGTVTLSLTANQTSNIASGRYVYDVKLTEAGGTISRIVEGLVTVNPKVT